MRPQFGMHRFDWRADDGGIEFHLGHGDWVRLLRANGFEILDLIEIQAPADAETHEFYDASTAAVGEAVAERGDLGRAQGAAPLSAPPAPPLLLASTSPQRRAILTQLGIPFDVVAPRYEEHDPPEADATELVCRHARGKAESVAGEADGRLVLGVDTTVVARRPHLRQAGERGRCRADARGALGADARGGVRVSASSLRAGRWSRRPRRSSRSAR